MNIDPGYQGELTGKIYGRMLEFLDQGGADLLPLDVIRWWAFWEAVCPKPIRAGRLFWLSLVISLRLERGSPKVDELFEQLTGWLTGEDEAQVEIVRLDGPLPPSAQ